MRLGISTYSFPWAVGVSNFEPTHKLTATDLLSYAVSKKITHVQFGDNYPLHLLSVDELDKLNKTADQNGIQLETGTRRLTVSNINNYISIAKRLGSPFLRVVIDDKDYHPDEKEVIQIINELLPQLKENSIILAIENHDRFPAQVLKRIIESTDKQWVGICLDTANSLGAGEGIHEVVNELAPYTINLHIKDFTIERVSHKMGFKVSGCVAGMGMLQIPQLIDQINKFDRCQTATLEVWSDPEPTMEATIQKEKEWVDKSIDYLKTVIS